MSATASRFEVPTTPAADFLSGVVCLRGMSGPVSAGFVRALAVTVAELADEINSVTVGGVDTDDLYISAARVAECARHFRGKAAAWRTMRPDAVADAVAEIFARLYQD